MKQRHESLDWLRGLMALAVMLFHLASYGHLPIASDASTTLGRLGIYAVSVFFVLSGLSMAIAYDRFAGGAAAFYVRRVFRIWQLLWFCVAAALLPLLVRGTAVDWWKVLLNVTTLFGFVAPSEAINTGAWSIGNEMVYYALTPLLLAAYHRSKSLGNALTAATIVIGLVFAFALLSPGATLAAQWPTYVNPLNNLFLYACGVALYFNDWRPRSRWWLAVPVATFVFYPVAGDPIAIVTGTARVAFSLFATGAVWVMYRSPPRLPHRLAQPLEQLGIATYGVYLLHPIVLYWTARGLARLGADPALVAPLTVVGTIGLALASYHFFEKPLMRVGKRWGHSFNSSARTAAQCQFRDLPRR